MPELSYHRYRHTIIFYVLSMICPISIPGLIISELAAGPARDGLPA